MYDLPNASIDEVAFYQITLAFVLFYFIAQMYERL